MKKLITQLLSLLVASSLLASCGPVHTEPLEGIVNWGQLSEAPVRKPFNQASFGLILSNNVEKEVKFYQKTGSFWGSFNSERWNNNYNFTSGVQRTMASLKKSFKSVALVNDLNECRQSKLDYCGVLDINRHEGAHFPGGKIKETFQLFLMNGEGGRIAAITVESGWHMNGGDNGEDIEHAEEDVLARLEAELQRISR